MKLFGTKRGGRHCAKKSDRVRQPEQTYQSDLEETPVQARRPRRGLRVLLILLAVVVLLSGGAFALWSAFVQPPPVVRPAFDIDPDEGEIAPPDVQDGREEGDGEIFTILVAGQDNVGTIGLTDTLMLVAIDTGSGAFNVVNIPRDTKVDVDWQTPKINSVFPMTGSIHRLVDEVEKMIGFRPDFHVALNLQAFSELVDTLGGVYFDVPVRMRYDDPHDSPPLHIHLDPGYQMLTGDQAVQLVRFRQNNDGSGYGDLGRVETQQAFLHAVAGELLQIRNVTQIGDYVRIFNEHVDTDLPLGSMIWLATQLMDIDSEDITFHMMPGVVGTYVVLELEEWLEIVNEYLNPFPVPVTEENVRVFAQRGGTAQLVGDGRSLLAPEQSE